MKPSPISPGLFPCFHPFCLFLFLRLVSNALCLLSYLSRTLCASHVFVSSYLFLSLTLIPLLLHHYILLHKCDSLTLTSPSSSMSTLMCLNDSRVLVSTTLLSHCHHGYLMELNQGDCQFQGEGESTHCDTAETQIENESLPLMKNVWLVKLMSSEGYWSWNKLNLNFSFFLKVHSPN